MNYIKRKLGITELIDLQKKNNELLEEIIRVKKFGINNDCRVHSQKERIY